MPKLRTSRPRQLNSTKCIRTDHQLDLVSPISRTTVCHNRLWKISCKNHSSIDLCERERKLGFNRKLAWFLARMGFIHKIVYDHLDTFTREETKINGLQMDFCLTIAVSEGEAFKGRFYLDITSDLREQRAKQPVDCIFKNSFFTPKNISQHSFWFEYYFWTCHTDTNTPSSIQYLKIEMEGY